MLKVTQHFQKKTCDKIISSWLLWPLSMISIVHAPSNK